MVIQTAQRRRQASGVASRSPWLGRIAPWFCVGSLLMFLSIIRFSVNGKFHGDMGRREYAG